MVKFVIVLYLGLTPFAIVDKIGWLTPAGAFILSLLFLAVDEIGAEIEDPFGTCECIRPSVADSASDTLYVAREVEILGPLFMLCWLADPLLVVIRSVLPGRKDHIAAAQQRARGQAVKSILLAGVHHEETHFVNLEAVIREIDATTSSIVVRMTICCRHSHFLYPLFCAVCNIFGMSITCS